MRRMKRTFKESLELGAKGEQLVINELGKSTQVKDYTNYNANKHYQQKGFDIEFFNNNTQTWDRADVKTNVLNGLTFAEMYNKHGKAGWIKTSKADYIICVDRLSGQMYYYSVNDMRNYIDRKEKDNSLKVRQVTDGSYGTWIPVNNKPLIKPYNDLINLIGPGPAGVASMGMGDSNTQYAGKAS